MWDVLSIQAINETSVRSRRKHCRDIGERLVKAFLADGGSVEEIESISYEERRGMRISILEVLRLPKQGG